MDEKPRKIRSPELKKYRMIGLTERGYKLLRQQKPKEKRSMMRILDNLLFDTYDNKTKTKEGTRHDP